MRIGIDASFLVLNQASGTRSYTVNLLQALRGMCGDDELVCFYNYFRGQHNQGHLEGMEQRVVRCPRRLIELGWRRLGFPPIDWLSGRLDVFHSVHMLVPPQRKGASVLTVHDLREFRLPHLYPHLQAFRPERARMARRAHRVIAISECTRQDAVELLGVEPDRIRVIHNGLDPRFRAPPDPTEVAATRSGFGLDRPYLLFLSSGDPRKCLGDALAVFSRLADRWPKDLDLAIAGSLPPGGEQAIRGHHLASRIRHTGVVGDRALHHLMSGARALLFTSLYEGFGLPILEAFACDTPVVARDCSSIPEVAGDAAVLSPASEVEAMAEGVRRIIEDDEFRQELIQRGRARVDLFSWEKAAREVYAVYQEAAAAA